MEAALELNNLSYVFSGSRGITDISLQVKRGEIYMLYGGHHAGKTLILQILSGAVIPQSGTIRLFGNASYLQEKRRIGYIPQRPYSLAGMSALEMLHYFALSYGILQEAFDKTLALEPVPPKPVCQLPLFIQRKINLGIALLGRPDFILFDNPFSGLDAQECEQLLSIISVLHEERNMTVLLTGEDYELSSRIVNKYGILSKGRLRMELTPEKIAEACRRCIKIRTPQLTKAITVIQNDFPQYEVLDDSLLRVFCPASCSSEINKRLVSFGIDVSEIGTAGMNPQSFLSALAGGEPSDVTDYAK